MYVQIDEDELKAELDELEQETLDAQLEGAHPVPVHAPGGREAASTSRLPAAPTSKTREEEDEDAELRELQAALAM